MGMFCDILVNAKAAVVKVEKKANDVCDISKLKFLRKRIKQDVYKNYTAIGRKYYAMAKNDDLEDADFSQELEAIADLHEQYDDVSKQIEDLKNLKRCEVCSAPQNSNNTSCVECDNKF